MTTKSRPDAEHRRLAVLIDADNAQPSVIEALLGEVAKFGVASVRRLYGNWTTPQLGSWKNQLLKHSIQPIQQFANTSGKNSTDSALIIDAMDLMYTRRFDGFCLVSSDSDFTRLAQRLREEGMFVIGFGEKKTPEPFVKACDKFIRTEVLRATTPEPSAPAPAQNPAMTPAKVAPTRPVAPKKNAKPGKPVPAPPPATPVVAATKPAESTHANTLPADARDLMLQAIDEAEDDSGWANLGSVGSYLTKLHPDFDARNYGHKKLRDLFRSQPQLFELEERGLPGATTKAVYARLRKPR